MSMTMKAAMFLVLHFALMAATSTIPPQPQPPLTSFKVNSTQNEGNCSYLVSIKTSCSSPLYTRDKIFMKFGDNANEVYRGKIDDPRLGKFRKCSIDKVQVSGPCAYPCSLHFYRMGNDGWNVDTVTIFWGYGKSIAFFYDSFLPRGAWFGSDLCNSPKEEPSSISSVNM